MSALEFHKFNVLKSLFCITA